MFGFLLFASLALATGAPPSAHASVATVSIEDFVPGRSWTWDYATAEGKPWSTERYTVISRQGAMVLLEIASDYGGSQNLKPNTRLLVNIDRCLKAYANPTAKKGWSIEMFSPAAFSDGDPTAWVSFDPPSTLAFEEKFNCNAHDFTRSTGAYLTVHSVIDGARVFQQKLWGKLSGTWFSDDTGIAFAKDFTADPAMAYAFKRR